MLATLKGRMCLTEFITFWVRYYSIKIMRSRVLCSRPVCIDCLVLNNNSKLMDMCFGITIDSSSVSMEVTFFEALPLKNIVKISRIFL